MNHTFKPCLDILPPAQKRIWPALRFTRTAGYVLYGGTAVALRCGHRVSVDFDFFSHKPLNKTEIFSEFSFSREATVLQDQPHTLTLLIPTQEPDANDVKLSFFGQIGIGRVNTPNVTHDGVLQVASIEDLLATKLKVILQRVEAKDYRDIVALITAGAGLPAGLAAANAMYGKQFQPMESLKALTFFADGDLDTLTAAEKNFLIKAAGSVRNLPEVTIVSYELGVQG